MQRDVDVVRVRIVVGHEHPALRVGLLGICTWEQVALATGVLPTITSKVLPLPLWARVLIALTAGGALFDHFVTRRWL